MALGGHGLYCTLVAQGRKIATTHCSTWKFPSGLMNQHEFISSMQLYLACLCSLRYLQSTGYAIIQMSYEHYNWQINTDTLTRSQSYWIVRLFAYSPLGMITYLKCTSFPSTTSPSSMTHVCICIGFQTGFSLISGVGKISHLV